VQTTFKQNCAVVCVIPPILEPFTLKTFCCCCRGTKCFTSDSSCQKAFNFCRTWRLCNMFYSVL